MSFGEVQRKERGTRRLECFRERWMGETCGARQAVSDDASMSSIAKFNFDAAENGSRRGSQNGASKNLRWCYVLEQWMRRSQKLRVCLAAC